MRLLLLTTDRYPPFRPASEAIFGSEFSRKGHRVDWIMPAENAGSSRRIVRFGRGVVVLAKRKHATSFKDRLFNHLNEFRNQLSVFALLRRADYDVVQVKDMYLGAVFALLAARLKRVPFCYWLAYPHAEADLHGAAERIVRYPLLYRIRGHLQAFLLYRVLLPASAHIFVQSEQMRIDIERHGVPLDKMTAVPGSLVMSRIPYRGSSDPGPDTRQVLYVGTLIRERQLDFLVRVFAKVKSDVHDARLVFVGGGENPEDEALLHREIGRLDLDPDSIVFTGKVPRDEVWRYIEESAVCLSPYRPSFILNSTSPTKLVEYMAMARAVVCNEHPEQSRVIEESRAGICCPWDEEAFASAISRLLRDPDACRSIGQRGRLWVERNRSSGVLADLVESRYLALTGEKNGHCLGAERTH